MKLSSISLENYLGVTKRVTLNLDEGLTTLVGAPGIDLNAIVNGLAIFFGYRWPQADDFPHVNGDLSPGPAMTITARFSNVPDTVSPDRHSYFRPSAEYLLQENGEFEITRAFRMSREGLQERVYASAVHPTEPGLNDLLQVNNTILKRRLTNSTVSATAVDRRCNSAIRHALWDHSKELSLHPMEVSLCRGDALLIWQALQMHFPLLRIIQGEENGAVRGGPKRTPHEELTRVAPRHYAAHRVQDLSLMEPTEMYDLPPSQQWVMVLQQIVNKTEPPVTIPADVFLRDGARPSLPAHGLTQLYCIQAPEQFADETQRARWITRLEELAAQPGNTVLLTLNLPTSITGVPTQSVCALSRDEAGEIVCLDERPLEQRTGIREVGTPRQVRASNG